MEMDRCPAETGFERVRVDCIEILERRNIGESGISDNRNQFVYNIEVGTNHNYIAGRILVANCKNYKAQRTKAAKELGKGVMLRLCLTGTPVLNRPQELLSPLAFLGRLDDMGGFWGFCARFCGAYRDRWGWNMGGAANLTELHEKLRATCYVRREKADVLKELPDKQRTIVPIAIDNRDEYEKCEADLIGWVMEQAANDEEFLASVADLPEDEQKAARQARANEAAYRALRAEQLVKIEALKQVAVKGKLAEAIRWIKDFVDSGEKLVVFAHHREIISELSQELGDVPHITLMGGDSVTARQRAIERFNQPDCRLALVSIQAGGTGINLQVASQVAFLELGWNPAIHDQAEDRLHRIGQKDAVNAWYLLAHDTIEETIAGLIDQKRAVVDAITDGREMAPEAGILAALIKKLERREA